MIQVLLVVIAGIIAANGHNGWGWFLFVALIID